jgi:hypothetical protein
MDTGKKKPEIILNEMGHLLDKLISGAENLLELSQQVIPEEEFVKLQDHQEELLGKLIEKDQALHSHKDLLNPSLQTMRKEIDRKIDLFQKLNTDFVEKISAAHGLIHFDSTGVKKKAKHS